jgi:predicted nucleic acid-binding protein
VGLNVIGTCGLLLQAKRRDLVAEVRPLVEELSDSGYYLSESLIEAVCRLAGEP